MTTVLPATSAVRMAAEQTTVRTPSVPEPRATSTSVRYVFPMLSLHDTVPACGSRVAVTISVCPAGMPPVGTVTAMVVPVAPLLAEPTFRTRAIDAHPLCDAPRRRRSLAVQLERSGAVVDGWDGATGPAWEAAAAVDRPRAARQDARP